MSCLLMFIIDTALDVFSSERRELLFRILEAGVSERVMLQMDFSLRNQQFFGDALAAGGIMAAERARNPIIAVVSCSPEYAVSDEAVFLYLDGDESPCVDDAYLEQALSTVARNLAKIATIASSVLRLSGVDGLTMILDNCDAEPTQRYRTSHDRIAETLIEAFGDDPLQFPNARIDVA